MNSDGTLDINFDDAEAFVVYDIKLQPDNKILLAGFLPGRSGLTGLVRLNPDGSADAGFDDSTLSGFINAIAVQPDGKILAGGYLDNGVARFNQDGTRDHDFNVETGANGFVDDIAVQPNGKILASGGFTRFNGAIRRGLVRLQGASSTLRRNTQFDFDGDARADIAVYRDGEWYLQHSTAGFAGVEFGVGSDAPVPATFLQ